MDESAPVRVEVDHERHEHERRGHQAATPGVELPPAGEVAGEERHHEQAEVAHQPDGFLVGELGGEPGDLERDGREQGEGQRLQPPAGPPGRLLLVAQDELLPQPAAVLAGELAGEGVEVAHPLDGDEEPLVGRQAGRVELGDLVAEMRLELVDVVAVDGRGLRDVVPPLGDL